MNARALAVLLAAALALAACGDDGNASTDDVAQAAVPAADIAECDPDGVTITVAHVPQGESAVTAAKAAMEAKHVGLEVEARPSTSTSYDELTQQVVADIAGGTQIDVVQSGNSQVRFYVDTYEPTPIDTSKLRDTYDTRFLEVGTVDGEVYMAPFQVSVPALFYNKTLMEEVGLDPESPPTNHTELFAAARKLKDVTSAAPMHVITEGAADWIVQAAVESAGADFVQDDGTPGFDTEAGIAALDLYGVPAEEGLMDPVGNAEATPAFTTGSTALLITSSASTSSLAEGIGDAFEWGVTTMPIVDDGEQLFPAGGNGWLGLSSDACEAAFASELIGEMLAPEVVAEAIKGFSYVPVDTEAKETLLADPALAEQSRWAYSSEVPVGPWGGWPGDTAPEANQILTRMVQAMANGAAPADVVPNAVAEVTALVQG